MKIRFVKMYYPYFSIHFINILIYLIVSLSNKGLFICLLSIMYYSFFSLINRVFNIKCVNEYIINTIYYETILIKQLQKIWSFQLSASKILFNFLFDMSFLGRVAMRLPSLARPIMRPTVFARAFAATQVNFEFNYYS